MANLPSRQLEYQANLHNFCFNSHRLPSFLFTRLDLSKTFSVIIEYLRRLSTYLLAPSGLFRVIPSPFETLCLLDP